MCHFIRYTLTIQSYNSFYRLLQPRESVIDYSFLEAMEQYLTYKSSVRGPSKQQMKLRKSAFEVDAWHFTRLGEK